MSELTTKDLKILVELGRMGALNGATVETSSELVSGLEELLRVREAEPKSAYLFCPECSELHVDKLEADGTDWTKRRHRKHLCHSCGHVWQPFDFPTYGVPLPAKLIEAIASLSRSVEEVVQERDALREKVAEMEGASIVNKNAIRIQRERAEGAEVELVAQKEMHAVTAAQLADALMERSTILDARTVAEMVKTKTTIKLRSLDKITVDGLLTLVKLTGSGGHVNGVTKPEGWPFVVCAAVGSPGNEAAVDLLREFDGRLQALGAPLVANVAGGQYVPNYQELLQALEPFRKVAAVAGSFNPPLSVRHRLSGRALPVYQLEHPGPNEHEQCYAELTARDFENLHVVLTGEVPEGW